jgi:hypothetical protein
MKSLILASVVMFLALQSVEVHSEQVTIDIPAGADVRVVDSTHCDPIYNEANNTMYVPRCYRQQTGPRRKSTVERILSRTVRNGKYEVESSVWNGIDRKIMEVGRKIDKAMGTY